MTELTGFDEVTGMWQGGFLPAVRASTLNVCEADLEAVGDEAAGVGGDEGGVFADADAGGFAADDPGADDGMIAGEGDFGVELLVDLGLGMPWAVAAFEQAAVLDEADVGAFAAEVGFFHVVAHAVGLEGGAEEVGVAFEHFPEEDEEGFVAPEHFPDGLHEALASAGEMAGEVFEPHPFPRVELEDKFQRAVLMVHEGLHARIPAEIFDGEVDGAFA